MADTEFVRKFALSMLNVEERTSYGTPAFFVGRTLFARFLKEDDALVVKVNERDRALRISAQPDVFYITDHYSNYPMMIVRLSAVDDDVLRELLQDAWEMAGR